MAYVRDNAAYSLQTIPVGGTVNATHLNEAINWANAAHQRGICSKLGRVRALRSNRGPLERSPEPLQRLPSYPSPKPRVLSNRVSPAPAASQLPMSHNARFFFAVWDCGLTDAKRLLYLRNAIKVMAGKNWHNDYTDFQGLLRIPPKRGQEDQWRERGIRVTAHQLGGAKQHQ